MAPSQPGAVRLQHNPQQEKIMPSGRMTKMHFISIATALGNLKPDRGNKFATSTTRAKGSAAFTQWRATVVEMANMCQTSNPMFDRQRFYAACGFEE